MAQDFSTRLDSALRSPYSLETARQRGDRSPEMKAPTTSGNERTRPQGRTEASVPTVPEQTSAVEPSVATTPDPRRKPVSFPDDCIRVEFTRELRVGNLLFAKGEAWDTRRCRVSADGSLNVGHGVVEPGQWREVCTWRPDVDAPPQTPAQRTAWESLHGKDAVRRG